MLKKTNQLDPALDQKIISAIDRAVAFVSDDQNLNLGDRDELFWAYAYRIRLLARLVPQRPELKPSLVAAVQSLAAIQGQTGVWFHEYPNPFVTATALIVFSEATQAGVEVAATTLEKGVAALARERYSNGGFLYSSGRGDQQLPPGDDNHVAASAGRMPVCELALWLHQASTDELLARAVERSFTLSEPFLMALKYDNHTSNMGYGGFFIWFDIEKRGDAILRIADEQQRAEFQRQQRELILALPEVDGCFVDSHELGRVYGSAMALLSLAKTEPADR